MRRPSLTSLTATEMSYTVHLSDAQFAILQDLINRGMEDKLAPFDDLMIDEIQELIIADTLAAVAFFNSHAITNHK